MMRREVQSTKSVCLSSRHFRAWLPMDLHVVIGLRSLCNPASGIRIRFCTSTIFRSSTFSVLRPFYFDLSSFTSLFRPMYFDLLSNLDFLLIEKYRSKYSFGRSKELKTVLRPFRSISSSCKCWFTA